jgi:hypothetical protein
MKRLSLIVILNATTLLACGEPQPSARAVTTTQTETQVASPAQHLFDPRMISIMVVGPEDELGVNPEANHPFAVSETLPPSRPVRIVLSAPAPDRVGRTSEIHVEITAAERE